MATNPLQGVFRGNNRLYRPTVLLLLTLAYFITGKLGLKLAFVHPSATPVWPPSGIALAALLGLGGSVWPAIFCGAFLVNITTAGSFLTSLGIATGNTLEGLVAAYLVRRFANGRQVFGRAADILKFALLAGLLSTTVSATVGELSLSLGGFAPWTSFSPIWLTWWLGDIGGMLVVAPFLILWSLDHSWPWDAKRTIQVVFLMACVFFVGRVIFGGLVFQSFKKYPLEFICLPVLLWVAFRFGSRETATAIVVLCAVAIQGTLRGEGPFARSHWSVSLVLLQTFMGVMAVTSLAVAAVVRERRQVMEQALQHSELRFRRVVESNIIGFMIVDLQGRILEANDAFLNLLGFTRQDLKAGLVGGPQMTPPEYHAMDEWAQQKLKESGFCPAFEKEYFRKDGNRVPVLVGVVLMEHPQEHCICFVIDATARRQAQDALSQAYDELEIRVQERTEELSRANIQLEKEIAQRKAAEEELRRLSLTDVLTGLDNRRGFLTFAEQHVKLARRQRRRFLLFIADVDRLKEINDAWGHAVGDQALIETARVLRATFRESDLLARIGGDEFAVIATEAQDGDAATYAARLQKQIDEINDSRNRNFRLAISWGVAVYNPAKNVPLNELMKIADSELYKLKRHRPVNFSVRMGA